ncbi:amidase [Virgibacillus sp. W0181]|uniref:amidase n=1 Tax=Virgibacillus sp. W0181 TaxID=3391581 RepID=UPI003F445667
MTNETLAYRTVKELSQLIANKEISPVELMDFTIKQIESRNDETNAFVYLGLDEARESALLAEQKVMNGEDLGLLHGIPTAIKDLFDFKPGWPSTFGGIPALKDNIADFYCMYAERVEQAGAIIVGKTNSPIMGFRGACDNPLFGPTKNPFDLSKNSGGSSGGSAAAVADGLIPIAEGTDGGGSIRIPASWSGVFGYQPSYGRVPLVMRPNAFGGLNPFLYEGTLTRTVEDAAIGMTTLSGYHPSDPMSLQDSVDYLSALNRPMKGWKIAYSPDFDVYPVDPKVKSVVGKAVQVFKEAGAHVEEVTFGINRDQKELSDLWSRMIMAASVGAFEGFKQQGLDLLKDFRHDLPGEFIYWLEHAYEMKTTDHIRDQIIRTEIYDAMENVFQDYDLIITPTLACLPVENATDGETKGPTQINGIDVDPLIGWCMTYFTNFTGHPAASIPAGLADNQYPVGMQIIGRKQADIDVFTASSTFEKLQPWQDIYQLCRDRQTVK